MRILERSSRSFGSRFSSRSASIESNAEPLVPRNIFQQLGLSSRNEFSAVLLEKCRNLTLRYLIPTTRSSRALNEQEPPFFLSIPPLAPTFTACPDPTIPAPP